MTKHLLDALKERGLVDTISNDAFYEALKSPIKVYCGFDPTSDSLHLGNLMAIIVLRWFQKFGHTPVAIIGGATGMIGDPSGKSHERNLLDEKTLLQNQAGIKKNIEQVLCEQSPAPLFLNNYDWFKTFSFLDFLRVVGKQFRIGPMLAKDSVKSRMQTEEGMSFTEFSYQLLQGYDFYHLFTNHVVTAQIGGSDQWGNITAGTEFIRKMTSKHVFGMTFPLLTKADGQKFGKSEKGAIWLSGERCSPYEFYQHIYRTSDADVITLLKRLTFIDLNEIKEIEHQMSDVANHAQKVLADTLCEMIHGKEGLEKALNTTRGMRPGQITEVTADTIKQLMQEVSSATTTKDSVVGNKLVDAITDAGFLKSKGEVRRLIKNGGLWLNSTKISDDGYIIEEKDLIENRFLLIALGKKTKAVIAIEN